MLPRLFFVLILCYNVVRIISACLEVWICWMQESKTNRSTIWYGQ